MHFAYAIRGRCGQLVLVPTRSEFARSGSTTSVENSLGSVLKSLPDHVMRLGPGWVGALICGAPRQFGSPVSGDVAGAAGREYEESAARIDGRPGRVSNVCGDGGARVRSGGQGRRAGRRGVRPEPGAGVARECGRDHPAEVHRPAVLRYLGPAAQLSRLAGAMAWRSRPLHGVVRLRERPEVLLHRAALGDRLLQPGPPVRVR